jgi:hypothetical protein
MIDQGNTKTSALMIKKITWTILFAIAMGMLESAVVIYLRELYYKNGFGFPLKTIPVSIARVEVWREFATVIMLVGTGILAGNGRLQRFAYFVLAFAVWDLFYYIFLYIFLGWPESLFTWDILFLIPAPWVGPVWAPCLLCLIMIAGSIYIIERTSSSLFKIKIQHWIMMIGGACVCILSFMWDYFKFKSGSYPGWNIFSQQDLFKELETYVPQSFNSGLFFTGFFLMCASIVLSIYKTNKHESQ